jgi:hypothetical protein
MQCYLNVVYFLISGNSLLSGGACQPPAPPKYPEASRAAGVQSRPTMIRHLPFKTNPTLLLHFRPQTDWTGPFQRVNPLGPGIAQVHICLFSRDSSPTRAPHLLLAARRHVASRQATHISLVSGRLTTFAAPVSSTPSAYINQTSAHPLPSASASNVAP